MIAALNISVVAHGATNGPSDDLSKSRDDLHDDPFEVPKALGILRTISSSCLLTVNTLVGRIQDNHERIKAKIAKKKKSEAQYYENRYGFDEQTLTGATYPN